MSCRVGELLDELVRKQAGTGGQDLAELGEGRPQLLERLAQPPGAFRSREREALGALGKAVFADDAPDLECPVEELPAGVLGLLELGLEDGLHSLGRVDDYDGAARVVRDPVRDVAEQELLAAAHARVPDYEDVRPFVDGGVHDRPRRIRVDAHAGASALPGELSRELEEARLRLRDVDLAVFGGDHLDDDELGVIAAG